MCHLGRRNGYNINTQVPGTFFYINNVPENHPVGIDNAEISCGIFAYGFE